MAKCVINHETGIITRIGNVEAFKKVNSGKFSYATKESYKEQQKNAN